MSLASSLNQAATLEASAAADRYGNRAFGSVVNVQCRFEKVSKTMVNAQGENEPIDGRVFFAPSITIDTGYRFIIGSTHYRVMQVSPIVDARGITRHFEVMVQTWR